MASEFMADATERIILALQSLGVSRETAGMVAAEWQAGVEQDWGGERPYIGKSGTAERAMSRRDAAIVREFEEGERVPYLARKYRISDRRVWAIIRAARGVPVNGD